MELKQELLYKHIGAKIAYFRKLNGISQKDFAKKLKLSESALSKIESGHYNENISLALLQNIAEGLNVRITTLITLDDQEKNFWAKLYNESCD